MVPPNEPDDKVEKTDAIRTLVGAAVDSFATGFQARHEGEHGDPNGTLNMKIHNVFIAALGPEIQYYTALVRSLDSSLGNMLERLAINIASLSFDVHRHVEGPLSGTQTGAIATLLEAYKRRSRQPAVADYANLRLETPTAGDAQHKRHDSDYYLIERATGVRYLVELKIGGDLDNKKARSEKEALLEQYAILANTLPAGTPIRIVFATAYNRFGEGKPWKQQRVRQYFADDELLIGKDFWDFVCQSDQGYATVIDAYREKAPVIKAALEEVKHQYLGEPDNDTV